LTLHLLNNKNSDNKENNSNKLEIISKNSWISNGLGVNREKFNWYRNYKIDKDYNFSQDNFGVKITGKLDFIDKENPMEKDLDILIPLNSQD
jgi:hypothetical protein